MRRRPCPAARQIRAELHADKMQPPAAVIEDRLDRGSMPEPNSGCVLWLGATSPKGYGQVRINGVRDTAHRFAWMAKNGPIPKEMMILHSCDVRGCVNPAHLRVGTAADNTLDMMQRGRQRAVTKLQAEEVRRIRQDSRSPTLIAGEFGISPHHVKSIRARRTWRHLEDK